MRRFIAAEMKCGVDLVHGVVFPCARRGYTRFDRTITMHGTRMMRFNRPLPQHVAANLANTFLNQPLTQKVFEQYRVWSRFKTLRDIPHRSPLLGDMLENLPTTHQSIWLEARSDRRILRVVLTDQTAHTSDEIAYGRRWHDM